ncbi:MAG: hypothetical protein KGM99_20365, partial [Burkholderiales bacterium]|nr:hypothetical protein [Burkholderiales bacterium]
QITQSELDISRTVGWFTCRYPAWFDLSDVAIGDAAQSIAQQRREIPSGGVGYGLLRYLGPEQIQTSLAQGYMPEISLNYLGQIRPPDDDVFTLISWTPDAQDRGLERASDLPLTHQISVEAMILNGQLKVLWLFNGRRFQMPEMQGLANEMVGNIRMMLMTAESASVAQSKESLV